jgi:hypothetical protein
LASQKHVTLSIWCRNGFGHLRPRGNFPGPSAQPRAAACKAAVLDHAHPGRSGFGGLRPWGNFPSSSARTRAAACKAAVRKRRAGSRLLNHNERAPRANGFLKSQPAARVRK